MPSSTFERVVQLLSDASHTYNNKEKIECLNQVKEFIFHREPSLLDNFLDEFMDFQHDRSPDVRRAVVDFIEEACKLDQDNLKKGVERLVFMIHDENPNVLKRVISCMIQIYRQALTLQARAKGVNKSAVETYIAACQIKDRVLSLSNSTNSGLRTFVIKFMEAIIILHSKRHPESEIPKAREADISVDQIPVNHRSLRPGKLEEEAHRLLSDLIRLGQNQITSINLQVIMSSLTNIAKQRPQFMSEVVQAFETMHVNLPPNLAVSQVASVRKALKNNLLVLLRHQSCIDYQTQITTLLTDLGATEMEVAKVMPKLDDMMRKRKLEAQAVTTTSEAKRIKGMVVDDDDDIMTPFVTIGSSLNEPGPGSTLLDRTAADLIPKMTAANVTDLVLLSMVVLPDEMPAAFQNTYTPIAAAGTEAQIKHLARLLAAQLVTTGLGYREPSTAFSLSDGTVDSSSGGATPGATPRAISTVISGGKKEESDGRDEIASAISTVGLDAFKLPMGPPMPPPKTGRGKPFRLAQVTKPLSKEVMDLLARNAFERILYASGLSPKESVQAARVRVLASLTAQFGKHFYSMLFDYIQEDVKHRFQLAIALLYHEFVKYQGFLRVDDMERCSPARLATYDGILTGLLHRFMLLPGAKDQYFGKLILEAPILTKNAFEALKGYCVKERTPGFGFRLLRDLIETRPRQKEEYMSVLLNFAAHERIEVRSQALDVIKELFIDESERIESAARQRLHLLLLPAPSALVFPFLPPDQPVPAEWTDDAFKLCLHLFLGVLPLEPSMLHELARVYVQTSSQAVKRVILRMLDAPVNGLGMGSPEVLRLVQECPKGAETLIMRVIHILTDKTAPSIELVEHVKELYNKRVGDVRFLIPVLTGLTKSEVINALPKMIQLNEKVVRQVFNRLLGLTAADPNYQSPVSAEELLVELHLIEFRRSEDSSNKPAADLKHIIQATQFCFQERRVYTQEKLSIVLSQLVDHETLPTLLMRSVMQALGMYPRLAGFVATLLQRLVTRQVWRNVALWEGYVKCCVKMRPQSYASLLQLPPDKLALVFEKAPDLQSSLRRHVDNFPANQRAKIGKTLLSVMEQTAESSSATTTTTTTTAAESTVLHKSVALSNQTEMNVEGAIRDCPTPTEEDKVKRNVEELHRSTEPDKVLDDGNSKLMRDKRRIMEERRKRDSRDKLRLCVDKEGHSSEKSTSSSRRKERE